MLPSFPCSGVRAASLVAGALVVGGTSSWAPTARAQASSATETVVVTGTRTPQRVDRALAELTVIDREQLDAAGGRTLAELLAGEPGVQFWSNGGLGQNASVSLRGLEARHTLLLVDGVRTGSATVGTPTWDNIPLDAIERIEIVRGPLSGLYGSDAVGGVIQIFTRRGGTGFKPDARVTVGSRGYAEAAAGARFGSGGVDAHLRLQHRRLDGASASNANAPFGNFNADNDGFEQSTVSARVGVGLGSWRAEATLLSARSENGYDDGPGVDARAGQRTQAVSAQLAGPVADAWRTTIRLARSRDAFDTLAAASIYASLGRIATRQDQFTWEHRIATPAGTALVVAERLEQAVERPGTPYAVSDRTINGLGLGLGGEAGAHGWQLNVRRDRNSQYGQQTTGSLGYGYNLTPALRATASAGTSYVAPSFNQLYWPGFGNPDLLPEEGRQRELGLVWRGETVTSRVAWFDNRIRGYISNGPLPANIPRVRVDGISFSADATLGAWTLGGGIDTLRPVNATEGASSFGRILPRRVQESARLVADWRQGPYALGGTLQVFGERFDNVANTIRLGGYGTLDLRAEWKPSRDWRLSVRLNNALDKRYETVFGYNQPGREAFLALGWAPR